MQKQPATIAVAPVTTSQADSKVVSQPGAATGGFSHPAAAIVDPRQAFKQLQQQPVHQTIAQQQKLQAEKERGGGGGDEAASSAPKTMKLEVAAADQHVVPAEDPVAGLTATMPSTGSSSAKVSSHSSSARKGSGDSSVCRPHRHWPVPSVPLVPV